MRTSLELAKWYSKLQARAEKSPGEVIAVWHKGFNESLPRALLEQHSRSFARLSGVLLQASPDDQLAKVHSWIEGARRRIELSMADEAAETGMGFRLVPLGKGARSPVIATKLTPRLDLSDDLDELEEVASLWSEEAWCDWLNTGFSAVRSSSIDAYLAFPPLRLYPVGGYVEQVAEALSERSPRGALLRERALNAVEALLRRGSTKPGIWEVDYWRLLRELEFTDGNVSVGRAYLKRKQDEGATISDETAAELCKFAWRATANESARAGFFQFFSSRTLLIVDAWEYAALIEEAAADYCRGEKDELTLVARHLLELSTAWHKIVRAQLSEIVAAGDLVNLERVFGREIRSLFELIESLQRVAAQKLVSPPVPNEPIPINIAQLPSLEGVI